MKPQKAVDIEPEINDNGGGQWTKIWREIIRRETNDNSSVQGSTAFTAGPCVRESDMYEVRGWEENRGT